MSAWPSRLRASSNAATRSSSWARAREDGSGTDGVIMSFPVEEGAQAGSHFLKVPFDGALGAAGLLGDLGNLVSLDAKFQHEPLLFRELFEALRDGHLQDAVGDLIVSTGCLEVVAGIGVGDGQAHVALVGTVEHLGGADAVEGNYEEEPPQFLAGGYIVVALADAAEEAPEHRLHNVFRLDAPGQLRRAPRPDEGAQTVNVADIQLGSRVLAAAAEAAEQGAVARGGATCGSVALLGMFLRKLHVILSLRRNGTSGRPPRLICLFREDTHSARREQATPNSRTCPRASAPGSACQRANWEG